MKININKKIFKNLFIVSLAITLFITSYYSISKLYQYKKEANNFEFKLLAIEKKLDKIIIDNSVDKLSRKLFYTNIEKKLQKQINDIRASQTPKFAFFTSGDSGYSYIKSNSGGFLVSLHHLIKYSDGYKVTFIIGNPTLIKYGTSKVTIRWGENIANYKDIASWIKASKVREVDITKPLLPGVNNKIDIVLPDTKAKETGTFLFIIDTNTTYLHDDLRK